jgi:hypothetical protein
MFYLFMILPALLGVSAIVMGVNGIRLSSIPLSAGKTLEGSSARVVGALLIVLGVVLIAFALLFPFILRWTR